MFNTQRSFFRPTYEDFQPQTETKDTPESHLLLIHLPGFARENISAKFDSSNRRAKVFGERPLGSNRWRRFNVSYPVPESCDTTKLQRKFEAGIVTITMPKKVINHKDQQLIRLPTDHHESKDEAKKVEEGKANSNEVKDHKGKEVISQEPKSRVDDRKKVEASYAPEATTGDSVTQKVQMKSEMKIDKKVQTDENFVGLVLENGEKQRVEKKETMDGSEKTSEDKKVHEIFIPGKLSITLEERKDIDGEKGEEKVAGLVLENSTSKGAEKKQREEVLGKASDELGNVNLLDKDQEIIPSKFATRVEEGIEVKAKKGQEEANEKVAGSVLETGKTGGDEKKGSEELSRKASDKSGKEDTLEKAQEISLAKATTVTKVNAPEGQGLKNENLEGLVSENGKNIRAEKKETKEAFVKASQVGNSIDALFVEKKRKGCTIKEKQMACKEGKGLKEVINYSEGKGMQEEVASGSQSLKRTEENFSEEDRQKMIVYVATAALAISVTIGLFNALRSLANS